MPSDLPKFRGREGICDPEEFVNRLGRVCEANEVPNHRYGSILLLCLEENDTMWFERWSQEWFQAQNARPT